MYLRKTKYNENMYDGVEHAQIEELVWALQFSKIILIEKILIDTANLKVDAKSYPMELYPMELLFHRGRLSIAGVNKKGIIIILTLEKSLQFSVTAEKFNRKKYEVAYHVYMKKLYGISAPINKN